MIDYSVKNIRKGFKENGVFYTPPELAIYMRGLLPEDVKEVYDPTCGSGNLLSVFDDDVKKYGQDIDGNQLNEARGRLANFEGADGDTLKNPAFIGKKFKYIIANPPFSIKWEPFTDERFADVPVLPPPSKADYAFILHILHYLAEDGKAVVMNFPGILYRGQREGKIRQWIIDSNWIEKVIHIPGNKFEDTSIATCILVLNKHKDNTDIVFVDDEHGLEETVPLDEVIANDYTLSVSTYITIEQPKEEVDPWDLEQQARRNLIRKIENEIEISKMICGLEGWSYDDLIRDIYRLLRKYRKPQKEAQDTGQLSIEDFLQNGA